MNHHKSPAQLVESDSSSHRRIISSHRRRPIRLRVPSSRARAKKTSVSRAPRTSSPSTPSRRPVAHRSAPIATNTRILRRESPSKSQPTTTANAVRTQNRIRPSRHRLHRSPQRLDALSSRTEITPHRTHRTRSASIIAARWTPHATRSRARRASRSTTHPTSIVDASYPSYRRAKRSIQTVSHRPSVVVVESSSNA